MTFVPSSLQLGLRVCRQRRLAALPGTFLVHLSYSRAIAASSESVNVGHSRFLAEAAPGAKWSEAEVTGSNGLGDRFDHISEGKGKLLPTSSHLFKLVLPLGELSLPANRHHKPYPKNSKAKDPPATVILLHPSQPLSHVSALILAAISPATATVSFRSTSTKGQTFQWSDSTDIGDFVRDAARAAKFSICLTYQPLSQSLHHTRVPSEGRAPVEEDDDRNEDDDNGETIIDVEVPTFADRTRFLRRRLASIEKKLQSMEGLKRECDQEAHRGAKRMAMGGFGMLIVYWGAVARLTFWDYGWDVMEPITYLSGLSTVICGYLWFLYQGREVSYTSVLDRSISTRREALYKSRGFDIEHWMDLMNDAKNLRKEIARIAEDYEEERNSENRESEDDVDSDSELSSETSQVQGSGDSTRRTD
ncbi:Calcium uniporter protein 5, mitochondrial [Hypsizygus marmoreus]|uniref:Calcium uniporter protein, mitochondrial n=1 Tax=Hypsizygus marmoreus TaxID=39966 RepID=A0A369K9Y7_HYPMA|nr:Calcium uniporter protein 5, mitochondrial [Hypsizygus marmoreus]